MTVSRDPLNPFHRASKKSDSPKQSVGERRLLRRALLIKPEIASLRHLPGNAQQGTSVSRLNKRHGEEDPEEITSVGHLRDDRLKFVPLPPEVLNPKKPKKNQCGDLS